MSGEQGALDEHSSAAVAAAGAPPLAGADAGRCCLLACVHVCGCHPALPTPRFRSVALVSKRFRALCLAPQLLHSLDVSVGGSADSVLQRSAALLQLLTAHAAHVEELVLDIEPVADEGDEGAGQLSDSQQQELAANVAGALTACAAAGVLQRLTVGAETLLPSLAWLPALRPLQKLQLGNDGWPLRLPAAFSRLTALADATLTGRPVALEGPLPPNLTRLHLNDTSGPELPLQARRTSAAVHRTVGGSAEQLGKLACAVGTRHVLHRHTTQSSASLCWAAPAGDPAQRAGLVSPGQRQVHGCQHGLPVDADHAAAPGAQGCEVGPQACIAPCCCRCQCSVGATPAVAAVAVAPVAAGCIHCCMRRRLSLCSLLHS